MTAPEVEAVLERDGRTVRVRCPFCTGPRGGARFHVHGVKGADGTLRYGPRVSHCAQGPRSTYILVPAEVTG